MGVLQKETDWMLTMTMLDMINHGFENIAVTKKPFSSDLKFLKKLQKKGFEKVLVIFGGYVWKNNSIIDYINNLDMINPVAGYSIKQDSELARQDL